MLARWFERSGIGQVLAPDPNAAPVSEDMESRSEVWQFLAPDENFVDPKAPPSEIFPPKLEGRTPSPGSNPYPETPKTPDTASVSNSSNEHADRDARVLSACVDTSKFMRSPMPERKLNDKFLRFCGSTKPLQKKLLKKMKSMVSDDNFRDAYLLKVRATRMGESAPDGYTALMVASYANHVEAAELILDLAKEYNSTHEDDTTYQDLHLDRDMFGMTALHIAAERGHVEMIQFLLPLYKFGSPEAKEAAATNNLIDLGGHTAFGRAVTSPVPKAKNNKRSLEKELFRPNDLSIFGKTKPMEERMGSNATLGVKYGMADMPGLRGYMEDAMCVETWVSGTEEYALFCVCDGHGDSGKISEFCVTTVKDVLEACRSDYDETNKTVVVPSEEYWTSIWQTTCLQLDQKLKEARLTEGGSTGVFALVTKQEIVVANVGDSRCIIAIRASNIETAETDENVETKEESADETTAESTPVEEGSSSDEKKESTVVVTALSEDHKPNLPDEAARIRMAGLQVESIAVEEEDGTETLIHKVVKSKKEQLAVSRAFGDFDYKSNTTLSETEQAIIPTADVVVHTRTNDDLYLVLACDGIWDVMNNDQVIEVVRKQVEIKTEYSPDSILPDVADVLLQECLGKESRDNLSAIVVSLQGTTTPSKESSDNSDTMVTPKALDFGSPTAPTPAFTPGLRNDLD